MIGEAVPFDDLFLDMLDKMTQTQAIAHLAELIEKTQFHRDNYEKMMLNTVSGTPDHEAAKHCWVIDCNNILRFKKLYDEVCNE